MRFKMGSFFVVGWERLAFSATTITSTVTTIVFIKENMKGEGCEGEDFSSDESLRHLFLNPGASMGRQRIR